MFTPSLVLRVTEFFVYLGVSYSVKIVQICPKIEVKSRKCCAYVSFLAKNICIILKPL
jgi:hypothetical protein